MNRVIGDRIRTARIQKGITQSELADMLAVVPNTIVRLEFSDWTPRPVQLQTLFRMLSLPMPQLTDNSD